ncbi:MAG: hypothetical protein H6617_12125 [Bdellovibrionaceae bacterium]|nr:hypothetical protein [Bdellovibrionales bacterium]MCB9255421.1 hypothetical protein [Pseudobdellovibrionaceae bacterium]
MKRTLAALFVLFLVQNVNAEDKKWFEEGFVKNALKGRAAEMLSDTGFSREETNWYRCGAISQAQFKHAELYINHNEPTPCYEDKDCAIGSLGGFCSVAAHKSQLEGYALYTKSPTYQYLAKNWRNGRCHGPVGLCLPVDTAFCAKEGRSGVGKCQGKWADRASDEPIFMRALGGEENK